MGNSGDTYETIDNEYYVNVTKLNKNYLKIVRACPNDENMNRLSRENNFSKKEQINDKTKEAVKELYTNKKVIYDDEIEDVFWLLVAVLVYPKQKTKTSNFDLLGCERIPITNIDERANTKIDMGYDMLKDLKKVLYKKHRKALLKDKYNGD